MPHPTRPARLLFAALLALAVSLGATAATVPASPALMLPATADIAAFKTEKNPVLSIDTATGSPLLKIVFPANSGYPGIDLPAPADAWDLSAYAGVEAEVANVGQTRVNIGLRVDNAGDWKKSPWNSNNVWLAPGEAKTVRVVFGESYGKTGYALDASRVSNIKLLADNPKADTPVLVKAVRAFGTASERPAAPAAPAAATPAASASSPAAAPATADVLFVPTSENIARIKTEKNPGLSVDTSTGAPALKVDFVGGSGYPGLDFPLAGGTVNLAAFAGIQAEVTNLGQSTLNINLRADNAGDWKQEPWNTNGAWIPAGKTQTVKLTFGQSHGKDGYALDASRISVIKLFAGNPKQDASILVKNLRPFGVAGERPVASGTGTPAPAAGQDATFSPSIGGELLDLAKNKLAGFKYGESSAVLENGKVKVTFDAGSNYPNIQFPLPKGGWDLAAFGNISVTVHNPNDRKITVFMRVDNPGHWKDEPWNTENLVVGAGETKTLTLTFGKQNGAPAFPLNPKRVSAIQVFIVRPKTATTLVLSDLKAGGSPADAANELSFTKPEDRNTPAVLPAWLGKRPPADIPGDWVLTLDENFDGTALNEKMWTKRFPWDGPQPGQLQRYVPENVTVRDGVAVFKVEKSFGHENNDPKLGTRAYSSGLIQSYDKWTQLYGYYEARIKVPYVRGLWPAYWMMPDRGAASGLDQWRRRDTGNGAMEIDIMEILSEWGPGRNSVAVHWDGYGSNHKQWGTSQIYYGPTADGFHVYGLLWEPGKLTWFVDGKKVAELENERVSKVPAYLKFNIQVGGWASKNVDESALPATMEVDYTRAWQLRERLR